MAKTTIDHATIRRWIEERGGRPARVKATGGPADPGILRVDFPGYSGEGKLEQIAWDQFFAWFDRDRLAFIYQDRTRGGQTSRFNKLVSRSTVGLDGGGPARGPSAARDEADDDAVDLLTAQHREVERMFGELGEERPGSAEHRRLFGELADALAVHTAIEEQLFYPAVMRAETEGILEDSVEEHLEAKRVLATLMETPPDGDARGELEELAGLVEEHVIEEEHDLFPIVRRLFGADDLRELGQRMTELETELRRGEPRSHILEETEEPAPI
ncbi:MAG TPA: hemerythrin domain-containing protein [Polyangia bacterium]|nr:hemerythrin domain-containing protein [Polyangia bacterium]